MMVVTDLDGTLLDPGHRLSRRNRATLVRLGRAGVVRVVATGRSLYSAERVMARDFPVDYLVFASGAGILDWRTRRLLHSHDLPREDALAAIDALVGRGLDFMLHHGVPDNHRFWYRASRAANPDFEQRCARYAGWAEPWPRRIPAGVALSQLLAIAPAEEDAHHPALAAALPALRVIRTTSPLDGRSQWVEIFPATVSKALGADWLRARHGVAAGEVLAVGNDYNDLDLLEWAPTACVVANAAPPLRDRFTVVPSNAEDGFSEAVSRWRPDS